MAAAAPGKRRALLVAAAAALVAALLAGGVSLLLPGLLSRDFDARSLASLRKQAARTRREFAGLLASLAARKARFAGVALPASEADFVDLFRASGLDTENEGIALTGQDGSIEAWYGNVLSPENQWDPEALEGHGQDGGTVARIWMLAGRGQSRQPVEHIDARLIVVRFGQAYAVSHGDDGGEAVFQIFPIWVRPTGPGGLVIDPEVLPGADDHQTIAARSEHAVRRHGRHR